MRSEFGQIHKWRVQLQGDFSALVPSTGSAEESTQPSLQRLNKFFRWPFGTVLECLATLQ